MDSIYINYSNVTQLASEEKIKNWKQNSDYRIILEHVSKEQGQSYLNNITSILSFDQIKTFCNINDSLGEHCTETFYLNDNILVTSPSCLRYLDHAIQILKHVYSINYTDNKLNIVEVGGGYGGLCLAVYYINNILFNSKYNIYNYYITDLDQPGMLQKYVTSKLIKLVTSETTNIHIESATTYGKNIEQTNLFLVSNYCMSEIGDENRNEYYNHLLPKVSHGFMIWNTHATFPLDTTIKQEIPLTGPINKILIF